jgi:hypothetical protein
MDFTSGGGDKKEAKKDEKASASRGSTSRAEKAGGRK